MEGFWTVQFAGVQGWGSGVITLMGGELFGGDGAFLYTGTYKQDGNGLQARVRVRKHSNVPGIQSVIGRDQFDLDLVGTKQGNTINAVGTVSGLPLRLNATLTQQGQLPARG